MVNGEPRALLHADILEATNLGCPNLPACVDHHVFACPPILLRHEMSEISRTRDPMYGAEEAFIKVQEAVCTTSCSDTTGQQEEFVQSPNGNMALVVQHVRYLHTASACRHRCSSVAVPLGQ